MTGQAMVAHAQMATMATVTVNKAALEVLRIEPQVTQVLRVQNIRIDSIRIGRRMRSLGDVNALIASIRELGLLNPITVTRERRLVSGHHRIAAFKVLGRRTIPAVVLALGRDEAQLCEIDENLATE